MNNNMIILKNKFEDICRKGWIESYRRGATGIGYTFEKLLGKDEDSLCYPDYRGIEIKTHRVNSKSYITLFNYSPIGESSYELKRLLSKYGYIHKNNEKVKYLNVNVFSKYRKNVGNNYEFSLEVNYVERKIYLIVYDKHGNFIEKNSYWTFQSLKNKLYTKLQYLAYVEACSKCIHGIEYFKYTKIAFYTLKNFDTFIKLISTARIRVSILISGSLNEKDDIKSHGASFSIKKDNINLLFNLLEQ